MMMMMMVCLVIVVFMTDVCGWFFAIQLLFAYSSFYHLFLNQCFLWLLVVQVVVVLVK
eukprot:m.294340 g.294340  ORF g.294340 m.294340 type:complete len:58 (+) comp243613_c0_seq1:1-174(+)